MGQTRVMGYQKVLVSLLILLVVGLHAIPVMFRNGRTQSSWPFLMWSMYKDSRAAGPIEARETRIIGLTSTGTTELITPHHIGLPRATVRELYLKKMLASDSSAARQLFSRVNANRKEPVVEIRIVSNTIGLTDSGIVRRNKPVMTFRADTSDLN